MDGRTSKSRDAESASSVSVSVISATNSAFVPGGAIRITKDRLGKFVGVGVSLWGVSTSVANGCSVITTEGLGVPTVSADPQATRVSAPIIRNKVRRGLNAGMDFIKIG
jgi:hypothetical protein